MPGRQGMGQDELRQMVRCVQLYYRSQRHQNEIARELGMSSSKVSRLLKRAFAEGVVRVEIELPKRPRLEAALVERFQLRDAVVIPFGEARDLKEDLGVAAARYFEKVAADGVRVGLSCGYTLYYVIRALRERRFRDLELYPLSAESTLQLVDLFPNTLVGMMAAKYRPHVHAYALPGQVLGSLAEIQRDRRRLLRGQRPPPPGPRGRRGDQLPPLRQERRHRRPQGAARLDPAGVGGEPDETSRAVGRIR